MASKKPTQASKETPSKTNKTALKASKVTKPATPAKAEAKASDGKPGNGSPTAFDGAKLEKRLLFLWEVATADGDKSPSIESLKHAAEKWSFTVEAVKRRWTRLEKSIPKLEKKYGGPKFTEKVRKENVAQENVAKKSPKQKEVSK